MALANACIWFGIAHRVHGNLFVLYYQLGMVADTCQDQRRGSLLPLSIFVARESRCLQWSHLAKVSGSSSELRSPTNNNISTTTQLGFLRCKYLYAGALFWGRAIPLKFKVQPGHSIGPRKLWNAGTLDVRSAPLFACLFYLPNRPG